MQSILHFHQGVPDDSYDEDDDDGFIIEQRHDEV